MNGQVKRWLDDRKLEYRESSSGGGFSVLYIWSGNSKKTYISVSSQEFDEIPTSLIQPLNLVVSDDDNTFNISILLKDGFASLDDIIVCY